MSVVVAVQSLLTYFNFELCSLQVPPDSNLKAEEPLLQPRTGVSLASVRLSPCSQHSCCVPRFGTHPHRSRPSRRRSHKSAQARSAASQHCSGQGQDAAFSSHPERAALPHRQTRRPGPGLFTMEAGGGRSSEPLGILAPPGTWADQLLTARYWFRDTLRLAPQSR